MPQIPFDVFDSAYGKTVHVVGSCDVNDNSLTLHFDPNQIEIEQTVFDGVSRAMDMPGVKRVQVCRAIIQAAK